MKKVTVFMLSMFACSAAFAAGTPVKMTNGQMVVKTTDTALLTENVSINLSTGVQAGASYDLDEISLSTCHASGRTSAREVPKTTCVPAAVVGQPDVCTEDVPKVMVTKSGAVMNTATTRAGTVAPVYPNVACTTDNAATAAGTKLTADN
jgi:hypothetical protein